MRFKAVISLCKKAKQVVLCDHKGIQWIGDGAALYAMYDMPEMGEGAICAVCDISDSQADKILFKEFKGEPAGVSLELNCADEVLLDQCDIALKTGGKELLAFGTSTGMEFVEAAYLRPFGDVERDYLEVYERRTPDGLPYFAVKTGILLLGLISPEHVITDRFVKDISYLARGCVTTLENEKAKTAEEEAADQMNMEEVS